MFSLVLVNGCPMLNGDLRGVGMTLYKGSNVECCPRGAAKVTEDNCVWHPPPAPWAQPPPPQLKKAQVGAASVLQCYAEECWTMQNNTEQCKAMQSNAVSDKCGEVEQRCNRLVHQRWLQLWHLQTAEHRSCAKQYYEVLKHALLCHT